jgi:hypothetical protein
MIINIVALLLVSIGSRKRIFRTPLAGSAAAL